ncbi:MAG: 23S rRNA (adenine(2503)-C(2))-methyltransferase RlmN [Elusimicrobia bacterium]|nr:23S rRNA (adenine(2503)-C(2))-methyltransferase RlmN [Elusimicrobiota bacterium]
MRFEAIKNHIKSAGFPGYRIKQVMDCIYRQGIASWDEAKILPSELKASLNEKFEILSFSVEKMSVSENSQARKALLVLKDRVKIETALLEPIANHLAVCVSSQAGCKIKCPFCATGKMGFKRNLSPEEISDQILFWQERIKAEKLGERISNVVFMGMGEPFFNYPAVADAIKNISNPDFLSIGQRHISISTAGHAEGILWAARDFPQVNLAVSIHTADNAQRNKLVPLNIEFDLEALRKAISKYIERAGRQVFIEYVLMKGINDSPRHARLLIKWIKSIDGNYLLYVNLIKCNTARVAVSQTDLENFRQALQDAGIKAGIRKSLGSDIKAACGQLAGQR